MEKYLLLIASFILTLPVKAQTVSDADGNTYNTVTIGTQTWLKENLKTTKYKDSTSIPNAIDTASWNRTLPAYCWYNNDALSYKALRGGLYNWYAVNTGKLCPTGWHVPSDSEWTTIYIFLGGNGVAPSKMYDINFGGSNTSGLTLRPTGVRFDGGFFDGITFWGGWWTGTEDSDISRAKSVNIDSPASGGGVPSGNNKKWGIGVRCIKDANATSINILQNPVANVIYPNPANDKLYIRNDQLPNAQILIFDLQGKQVISRRIDSNPIDISSLSKGVYTVKIVDSGNIIMEKLIKK